MYLQTEALISQNLNSFSQVFSLKKIYIYFFKYLLFVIERAYKHKTDRWWAVKKIAIFFWPVLSHMKFHVWSSVYITYKKETNFNINNCITDASEGTLTSPEFFYHFSFKELQLLPLALSLWNFKIPTIFISKAPCS